MAETTENKTANTDEKPAPKRRGRPATAKPERKPVPDSSPKSIQQAAEEDKPKITAAKSTLPKVEGFRWTLDSSTLTLHLHVPGNPYQGYTCGIEKNGGREALFAARDYLLAQKQGKEELLELANKITNAEEVTV